ncbi:MAG: ABC transporter substrate-binding protein [Erysipelothrix sp.]|nr:ABC transporter substrate-binding protein [Erysipelothrix sp.]
MKKILGLLSALLVLSACGSSDQGGGSKLILGMNFDLSGGGASYGQAESKGAKLAVKLYNEKGGFKGEDVVVKEYDNQTVEAEAYRVQTVLADEDQVFAIIGATTSGTSVSANKASVEFKVPTISPSATADKVTNNGKKGYEYVYRVCFADSFQGITMANFASNTMNISNVAIIGDSSQDYAKGLMEYFTDQFTANGGNVVATEYYVKGDKDFASVLTKLKGDSSIEALFIPGYYDEVGLIIKQARELGITLPILGVDGFESPELMNIAGAANLNDVYYSNHYSNSLESAERTAFVDAYKAEYNGEEPNGFAALAFDAANLALDALDRAGEPDAAKVDAAIFDTKDLKGVTGAVSFDDLHNAVKSAVVIELVDGVDAKATLINP